MKKYKYFFISDSKKEAIGKVKALTEKRAIQKASYRKQLATDHFFAII